jgi:acid phosphatase type 7
LCTSYPKDDFIMAQKILAALFVMFASGLAQPAAGQNPPGLVGDWTFQPNYTLPAKAANYPGAKLERPAPKYDKVASPGYPFIFYGEEPTDRISTLLAPSQLPNGAFSVELWLVDHVNQPVGVLVARKSKVLDEPPAWLLGYFNHEVIFSLNSQDHLVITEKANRSWKSYWHHLVATYDGQRVQLWLNGERRTDTPVKALLPSLDKEQGLELAGYFRTEPYMELPNLVKNLRLYDRALTAAEVAGRFEAAKNLVERGHLFPNLFHFNAGPYLHYATQTSINLTWETDRPAQYTLEYGPKLPLTEKLAVRGLVDPENGTGAPAYVGEATLTGLAPATQYFYNVKAVTSDGQQLESGVLTFATAVPDTAAFSFALIGDTEARPHVNNQVAKLIWDERPNFVVHLGDITDGGKEPHKFEWNYEYFAGMTQLTSRIPIFTVAGNGESDLFWYGRYHRLPEEHQEAFYSFRYGNAEFYMLNSNEPKEFAPGGKQYEWLKGKLQQSTARWKFVAHHHAPYSADEDDYGNTWRGTSTQGDPNLRQMAPLLEQYGVDMVLFGHLHSYQRTLPVQANQLARRNGVVYLQCGGAGGNLEDFAPTRAWFSAKTYRGHHYCTVSLQGGQLSLRMYDTEGRLKDWLELSK